MGVVCSILEVVASSLATVLGFQGLVGSALTFSPGYSTSTALVCWDAVWAAREVADGGRCSRWVGF